MSIDRKKLGEIGEKQAEKFLKKKGYKIIRRNYRCPLGEIDLIAWDDDYLVFIEVKTRSENGFVLPEEAVDSRKQKRLARLAAYFISHTSYFQIKPDCRFDVVSVNTKEKRRKPVIKLFQNAFDIKNAPYTL